MHQFFADERLIMGGPFLDNQGGLGILNVANDAWAAYDGYDAGGSAPV
jgi:hypothetical protein